MWALKFVMHDALGGGGPRSLRADNLGKTLGAALLRLRIEVPDEIVAASARRNGRRAPRRAEPSPAARQTDRPSPVRKAAVDARSTCTAAWRPGEPRPVHVLRQIVDERRGAHVDAELVAATISNTSGAGLATPSSAVLKI